MSDQKQHERIKGALILRGLSLKSLADDLGVVPTAVSLVSQGKGRSRRIEAAIASAVGSTPERIWPDRYPEQKGGK